MIARAYDHGRAEAFAKTMLGVLNSAALALMTSVGHRTGLFDVMARLPAATSAEIAHEAGLNERYVREWLGAMVTGRVVEHDPEDNTYWLPREHAAALTRGAVPNNLAATAQWVAVLASAEDPVVAAFAHGRGVPYSAYRRFHEVMAEESDQTAVAGLEQHVIPLVPGLHQRLRRGIDVLDVGCGSGHVINRLAALYPASRLSGLDLSAEAVAAARAAAKLRGLRNVRFEVADAARLTASPGYDLITAFDAIHDQARPADVLANVARALRPGGVVLMQDIAAESCVHGNRDHPLGPLLYTISCMHCMSVSLANGGPGLGATWGRKTALRMLRAAGFRTVQVEQLPHDAMNDDYVATL
jgi:SAM-dependent methyltransferase